MRFQVGLPESVNFTQFGTSAISPDGRKIVFAAYGYDGTPRVWIRSLDSATATPLRGHRPQSADRRRCSGRRTAGSSPTATRKQLRKIDITGGPSQALAEIAPAIGGSWNADGTILVGSTSGIMKLSANGGTPTPVTKPGSPQEAHVHPVFLPDGRHFLYMRGLPPGKRTIEVGDLNAAPDAQSTTPILTNDYGVAVTQASAGGSPLVLFLRDGTLLAQEFDMNALALTGSPVTVMEQVAGIVNAALGHFSVSNTGTLVYRSISGNNRQLTWYNRQGEIVGPAGRAASVRHDESLARRQQGRRRAERPAATGQLDICGSSI